MSNNKYYSIFVGGREPQKVQVGFLNKSGLPDPNVSDATIAVGQVSIPNYSKVWGKLKEKNGKITGDIEFMPWGKEGGGVIEIRYLQNCTSLSRQYQEELKLKPQDSDAEIKLSYGINDFDYSTERLKIEMLKYHTCNGNNAGRNPSSNDILFTEHNPENRMKDKISLIDERHKAEEVVFTVKDNKASLAIVSELFGLDIKQQDGDLVEQLFDKATSNPKLFNYIVEDGKQKVIALLKKAEEYLMLDSATIKDEILLVTESGKKKLIAFPADVKNKFIWIADNYFEADVYEAIRSLSKEIAEYEKNKLN